MRSRGFTLIELLVVMVIMGVIISLAVLSISDNRHETLEREARRLEAVLQLAAEEAVLRGDPLGVRFERDGYRFARFRDDEWTPVDQEDRFLREHELPEPIELELIIDGHRNKSPEDKDTPQVMMLMSGEMTPFELVVIHPELKTRYLIEGHLHGKLDFERED